MNQALKDLMAQAKEQRQKSRLNSPLEAQDSAGAKSDESAEVAGDLAINVPRQIQVGNLIFDYWEKKAAPSGRLRFIPVFVTEKSMLSLGTKLISITEKLLLILVGTIRMVLKIIQRVAVIESLSLRLT